MTRSRWMQRSHPGPRLRFFYGEQHSLQLCGTAPSSDTGLGSFLCARHAPYQHYARASLLVVDEVGYLSCDARNADLLFQVVSRRYEEKSLVLTTNLPFGDWATIFPNAACATALIDS